MVNITLFELHLEGAEFTANAPKSGDDPATDETDAIDVEDDSKGGFPFGLLAILGVFAAVASILVAKKVLGGSATDEPAE